MVKLKQQSKGLKSQSASSQWTISQHLIQFFTDIEIVLVHDAVSRHAFHLPLFYLSLSGHTLQSQGFLTCNRLSCPHALDNCQVLTDF